MQSDYYIIMAGADRGSTNAIQKLCEMIPEWYRKTVNNTFHKVQRNAGPMCEQLRRQYPFHKKKIILHRASMKAFLEEQSRTSSNWKYLSNDEASSLQIENELTLSLTLRINQSKKYSSETLLCNASMKACEA